MFKVFEAFPLEKFQQIVINAGCDHYVKKLDALKLLYLMIIAQFSSFTSLQDIANRVIYDKHLQKVLQLTSISTGELITAKPKAA
ncbi:DUF4372 domain-containing protein [Sporomusa carbonis]|uniref:DUF4372 domain-containing protein n=1 Tax=Sporomusa carbonis TaxID=3076075 RepID=UPI003C7DDE6A